MAVGEQEAAHCGGDLDGVPGLPACRGVFSGGMEAGPLGFYPGGCLLQSGQLRCEGRRGPGGRAMVGGGPGRDVLVSGQHGMQVIVQQPPSGGVTVGLVFGGRQGAGMLPEQVV